MCSLTFVQCTPVTSLQYRLSCAMFLFCVLIRWSNSCKNARISEMSSLTQYPFALLDDRIGSPFRRSFSIACLTHRSGSFVSLHNSDLVTAFSLPCGMYCRISKITTSCTLNFLCPNRDIEISNTVQWFLRFSFVPPPSQNQTSCDTCLVLIQCKE